MSDLTTIPNVGPAVARKLVRLGIERPGDLAGEAPEELFERLCALDGRRHDPCLLDTFVAAVAYADGGPARPWWGLSCEGKSPAATSAGASGATSGGASGWPRRPSTGVRTSSWAQAATVPRRTSATCAGGPA